MIVAWSPSRLRSRLADRNQILLVGHFALDVVEHLAFEKAHRVVVPNRRLEQPLGVVGRAGRDHLDARDVREPGLERLRVLRRQLQRGAVGTAKHDRDVELAARHVEHLRRGIEHLVEREHGEVPRHELDDRTQADHRRADAHAGESELGDRRVDDAHLAEFLEQSLRYLVRALVDGDFLSHEEDAVVALHLFTKRRVQRVSVCDDWHCLRLRRRRRRGSRSSYRSSCRRRRLRRAPRAAARDSCRRNPTRPARRP